MQELKDKVVLITGGSRGIGRAVAEACAKAGMRVAISARSAGELDRARAEIERMGHACRTFVCDVSRNEDVVKMVRDIEARMGAIYGLICAAGVYGEIGPFWQNSIEKWEQAIDINLKGTARVIHAALPAMIKAQAGRIVLFSGGGKGALPNFSSYVTGKGGITRLTETLGEELAPHRIYVNALAPGAVNTKLLDELLAAGPERVGEDYYKRSIEQKNKGGASPEKTAALCLYFLSARSAGLHGKTLSAIWDKYEDFTDLEAMSRSDIYTNRRVTDKNGGTRP